MVITPENLQEKFFRLYREEPLLVRSPGRINLIGEHTDYNDGFVLPAAIDRHIFFTIAKRDDTECRVQALNLNEEEVFQINLLNHSEKGWPNYLIGVIEQLRKGGYPITGFHCLFGGDIPVGAGLSSSAALTGGFAFTLNELFEFGIDRLGLARMARAAENTFVGVQCGIMDQFANLFGSERQVIKLDCRSLAYEYYPFQFEDVCLVLCDTCLKRSLANSEYNLRRQQCKEGVRKLQKVEPHIKSLRDVSVEMLKNYGELMEPVIYRRCDYVVRENLRVESACDDLEKGDLKTFGQRMYQSHGGLRDDYQVSCPELDLLVDISAQVEGVFGSRMMGGGFGGCTINLVRRSVLNEFTARIRQGYKEKTGKELKNYLVEIGAGTSVLI